MRQKKSDADCSPSWSPNRVFLGALFSLSAISAGVLLAGSQLATPAGLRQLTPEDAANLYRITVTTDAPSEADTSTFLRKQRSDGLAGAGGSKIAHRAAPKLLVRHAISRAYAQAAARSAGALGVLRGSARGMFAIHGSMSALLADPPREMTAAVPTPELGGLDAAAMGTGQPDTSTEPGPDTSRYQHRSDSGISQVTEAPVSTFAMDVDTGSYSNVRGYIKRGVLPPMDAVRVEEMINYFPYDYPQPSGDDPFAVTTETARCPWNQEHLLLRIGVQTKSESLKTMPPANLVFLVDVSGSMQTEDKLPLLQDSLRTLVASLRAQDRVSIVTYAGRESIALAPTPGSDRVKILAAINELSASGSTAGEAGIRTAYDLARRSFVRDGINRVILATDGDFNVGVRDTEQLKSLVAQQRKSGVYLSTLGFGSGNYNDELMEQIADVGNGNYSYIDSLREGRKVLRENLQTTLHTVAKDVKVQVEFQPARIREYRLVGYENRMLAREDFKNDAVDAGEIGAGTSVTAIYELWPVGSPSSVEPLRYKRPHKDNAAPRPPSPAAAQDPQRNDGLTGELAFVRVRYQSPTGGASRQLEHAVHAAHAARPFAQASDDFRFAAAVAGFGQALRGGRHTGDFDLPQVVAIADHARGQDPEGYRREFVALVRETAALRDR
jgi:Ca-activated chloride channel family protein